MSRAKHRFQLKAGNSWEIREYRGRPRIVINRDNVQIRQEITGSDVLSVARVKELIGWLQRYVHMIEPTEASTAIASIRASTNGVRRGLSDLEATQKEVPR